MSKYTVADFSNLASFNKILCEIDTTTIKVDYIHYISASFSDRDIRIEREDIITSSANLVLKLTSADKMEHISNIQSMRAFIDVRKLCDDVLADFNTFCDVVYHDE